MVILINIPTIAGSVNSKFQFKLHPCVRLGRIIFQQLLPHQKGKSTSSHSESLYLTDLL